MLNIIFSHWYLYVPLITITYLMIGSFFGGFLELVLRRLDDQPLENMSVTDRVLAYTFLPISMMAPENKNFSSAFVDSLAMCANADVEERYAQFRYAMAALWPFCIVAQVFGWFVHICWGLISILGLGLIKLSWTVVSNVSKFFFNLPKKIVEASQNRGQSKIVTVPMFVPPHEDEHVPDADSKRQRVAELRTRVATREAELDAEKRALFEAEMEAEADNPPYRGLSAPPAE